MNLKGAKEFLENLGYRICYIGIYGSQNYGLDINTKEYQSDLDYKAVCIPTLRDLVNNSKPVSKTYDFEGGQIDLKDIRIWTETLVKCNPAYIETLYTTYCWYSDDYKLIINEKDNLISEMGAFLLKACYGMILEKVKALSHPYPTIKDKIDKYGYDPKQLHHIVRLFYLMEHFVDSGKMQLINGKAVTEYLVQLKLGDEIPLKLAEKIRDNYVNKAKELRDNYKIEPKFNTKGKILQLSKDLVYNSIKNEIMDN